MRSPAYSHRDRHKAEGFFKLKAEPGPGMCMVSRCRNEHGKGKFSLCSKCYMHRWRMMNPKQSAFAALRDHAKDRGIEFTISYDYWLGLSDAYAMWSHAAESFGEHPSFDRIDGSKGYIFGNIRIITVSQNSRKAAKEKFLPAHVQAILDRKRAKAKENPHLADEQDAGDGECPF